MLATLPERVPSLQAALPGPHLRISVTVFSAVVAAAAAAAATEVRASLAVRRTAPPSFVRRQIGAGLDGAWDGWSCPVAEVLSQPRSSGEA